jgi:hypothetical protein
MRAKFLAIWAVKSAKKQENLGACGALFWDMASGDPSPLGGDIGGVSLTFLCKYASFSLQLPYLDVSWLYLDRILLYCHDTEKYG